MNQANKQKWSSANNEKQWLMWCTIRCITEDVFFQGATFINQILGWKYRFMVIRRSQLHFWNRKIYLKEWCLPLAISVNLELHETIPKNIFTTFIVNWFPVHKKAVSHYSELIPMFVELFFVNNFLFNIQNCIFFC